MPSINDFTFDGIQMIWSLSQLMITFGVLLLKELTGVIAGDDSSLFPLLIEKQNILGSVDSVDDAG